VAASPFRTALLVVLAGAWGVPRCTLLLVAGVTTRDKTVLTAGDGGRLIDGLTRWLERGHG